jgi:hypothetical protein
MDDDVVDLTAFESVAHAAAPSSPLRPRGALDPQRRADDIKRRIADKRKECDAARDRYRQLAKELKDLELALDSIHSAASRSRTDWGGRFDWSDRVAALLERPFRLPAFRPHQAEIINAALAGRDVLVVLPTGGACARRRHAARCRARRIRRHSARHGQPRIASIPAAAAAASRPSRAGAHEARREPSARSGHMIKWWSSDGHMMAQRMAK